MAQILNSKWLFASNSPVFVEWVIIINAKWAIFQLYHDESFLERVIIFQRYHGKNKLYLMRWFPLCTRPFEHTYQSFLFILWFCMLMEEASNTNFYLYSLYFDQGLNVPSTTPKTTNLSITPPVRFSFCGNMFWLLFFIFQSPHKYIIWFFICIVIYYSLMIMTEVEIFHCSARWVAFG